MRKSEKYSEDFDLLGNRSSPLLSSTKKCSMNWGSYQPLDVCIWGPLSGGRNVEGSYEPRKIGDSVAHKHPGRLLAINLTLFLGEPKIHPCFAFQNSDKWIFVMLHIHNIVRHYTIPWNYPIIYDMMRIATIFSDLVNILRWKYNQKNTRRPIRPRQEKSQG